jgi:molybdenum cofactor cytidylyltransferase
MSRFFAIIPAAGNSTRMGAPKLLLPVEGKAMMEKTLARWAEGKVERIVVVIRPNDLELANLCRAKGAEVVVPPTAPPEMKDSVQFGLEYIKTHYAPAAEDAWLLAPADMPKLSPQVINTLIAAHNPTRPEILVPTLGGRRGHPVLFPWTLAQEVFSLGPDKGLNVLRQRHAGREVPCDDVEPKGEDVFRDIDTPEDFRGLT